MKKTLFLASSCLLAASLFAAPPKAGAKGAAAGETVAEGYCAWTGVTEANYVYGCRHYLCPSDLRHKLTVVFYVDAAKFGDQFKAILKGMSGLNPPINFHTGGETAELSRNKICLIVLVGKEMPTPEDFKKFFKDNSQAFSHVPLIVYRDVTGSKVPDHGGKLPFWCAFGPESGDPLGSGLFDDAGAKKLAAIKRDKKNILENWKPYYGTVEEPKAVKNYTKRLNSGKPLDQLVAECQKGISNKDPEKAKECQILFDALEQARSDGMFAVQVFGSGAPTRAIYEAQNVMKKFQKTKKIMKERVDRMMAIPDVSTLYRMYCQLKKWGADDFQCKNAGEAKKYETELLKMKKTCDGLIEKSKVGVVQSAAAWIGSEAESLAPQMAGKVPAK